MSTTLVIDHRRYHTPDCDVMESYWRKYGNQPLFRLTSNMTFKGYDATLRLQKERLFLIGFSATTWRISDKRPFRSVSFEDVFPNQKLPLFAEWFSGTICTQVGKELSWNHHFGSTLEYSCEMFFREGELVDCKMTDILVGS